MRSISNWLCRWSEPMTRYAFSSDKVSAVFFYLWGIFAFLSLAGSIIVMIYGSTLWLTVAIVWCVYTVLSVIVVGSTVFSEMITDKIDEEPWWEELLHLGPMLVVVMMSFVVWVFSGMKKTQLSS